MRVRSLFISSTLIAVSALASCNPAKENNQSQINTTIQNSQRLNDWFEARFQDELARSPMTQTYYGAKDAQDRLDDVSQLAINETAELKKAWLLDMKSKFQPSELTPQSELSYRLYEYSTQDELTTHAFSSHDYVFQHMNGPHTGLPSFLINFHSVKTLEDAEDLISRLNAFKTYLGQYADRAQSQFDAGVSLPKFVYPKIIDASRNVITGAPFDNGEDSPLYKDISDKINALEISQDEKARLENKAKSALLNSVRPAYNNLIAMFETHMASASDDDGVWKLPKGAEYYQTRLNHYTTTTLTADEIHEIGLKEVDRIQNEMRDIMKQVGFEGDLKAFYNFLRTDPQFIYPNTDAGREAYITEATAIIEDMKGRMDSLFITKPKADMIVKRVEPFREDTAFGAFYNQPATDGTRPGIYYINLRDMADQPKYLMQALAYHEGIPGHHMQIAIGMELQNLPKFRTLGGFTSYIEGWALYAESVPKELGLYTDPYSDFGRLSMEIFRAARLVVDTGIHSKKWTREDAVQYYLNNIPNPEGDVRAEIDRYIVWPGQATAYKIGMLKIQELRKQAETALGDDFDIRKFHEIVLNNGAVPLTIIEELVETYISDNKNKTQ